MMVLTVSTTVSVLAIIGLVVGLVVLLVVINLLNNTLTPLRETLADVKSAHTAPMLERGVPGTEQLGQTRRLADSVPALALAYLAKLGAKPAPPAYSPPAYSPPPPAYSPPAAPTYAAPASSGGVDMEPPAPNPGWEPPAWKRYSS